MPLVSVALKYGAGMLSRLNNNHIRATKLLVAAKLHVCRQVVVTARLRFCNKFRLADEVEATATCAKIRFLK